MTALLFLHGINHSQSRPWDVTLSSCLKEAGYPGLADVRVIAPDYDAQLSKRELALDSPPAATYSVPKASSTLERLRREYFLEQARLLELLAPTTTRDAPPIAQVPRGMAKPFALGTTAKQARNYLESEEVRAAVCAQVLADIGDERRLVVLAHSLGTLVALNVMPFLQRGTEVPLLVTVASPIADPGFYRVLGGRHHYPFPYGRVFSWVNLFNPLDAVAGGRGVQRLIPEALDVVRPVGLREHELAPHLESPSVAAVFGDSLFGLRTQTPDQKGSRKGSLPSQGVLPLLMAQYCQRIAEGLDRRSERARKIASRYSAAVDLAVAQLERQWEADEELQAWVRELRSRTSTSLKEAFKGEQRLLAQAALVLLIANPVNPFEIKISDRQMRAARDSVAMSIGVAPRVLEQARSAIKEAQSAFKGPLDLPKPVWFGLAALGAAAAIAAPFVLFAAGAAGAVGAAALTSALAAFGPGGMVGGLLTLSASVGGGSAVFASSLGQAMAKSSPGQFRQAAVELMAVAHLEKSLLVHDAGVTSWLSLTEAMRDAVNQSAMHEGISDPRSAVVRAARERVDTARRALDWMQAEGFADVPSGTKLASDET